jgi:hypothetical protein
VRPISRDDLSLVETWRLSVKIPIQEDIYCSNAVLRWLLPTPIVPGAPGEWALVDDEYDENDHESNLRWEEGSLHT